MFLDRGIRCLPPPDDRRPGRLVAPAWSVAQRERASRVRMMANRAPAFPSGLASSVAKLAKEVVAAQVVALLNERSQVYKTRVRQPTTVQSEERLFPLGAVVRRVHGDVTTMMVGGVSGLLLQMLHPAVLAGVWDHSSFRADMQGRLSRTARFITVTTYGSRSGADAAIARVRRIHERVRGTLPSGVPYAATDPSLLAWVHVTEATSFLNAWVRYSEPRMSAADQDRYFAETAHIAGALGADPIPRSRREARELIEAMRPQLACDARARHVAQLVLTGPPPSWVAAPVQALGMHAAIDLLPGWARHMHGLSNPTFGIPIIRAGTIGLARTLRWALE
jgi:uncharacterized protein (DUF2236 family)